MKNNNLKPFKLLCLLVLLVSRPLKSIFQRKILFYECFADFFQ